MIQKRLVWYVILGLIGVLIGVLTIKNSIKNDVVPQVEQNQKIVTTNTEINPAIAAKFFCDDNKTIGATFNNKDEASSVDLTLSDGRSFSLPQTISASGARYANADESIVFWNKGENAFLDEADETTFNNCSTSVPVADEQSFNNVTLNNPASTNCKDQGGKLVIQTRRDGSQYGLCYFDDARACEEWAMFNGDCPVGGVKTTGYDNVDQKYCAWLGGKTIAEIGSVCVFKDESICVNSDLYSGTCKKGDFARNK